MEERPGGPAPEPRQRWRVAFARAAGASKVSAAEEAATWAAALVATDLPFAIGGSPSARPKLSFAAPAPSGVPCERELLDLVLLERRSLADVRARLEAACPAGHRIVDLFDVWLGEPSLTASVAAADYRLTIIGATTNEVASAARIVLEAASLPRTRLKGEGRSVDYDLRPLLIDLVVSAPGRTPADNGTTVRARLRLAPDGPSGRVEELVRALGEAIGRELIVETVVRERVLTIDELVRPRADGPHVGVEV